MELLHVLGHPPGLVIEVELPAMPDEIVTHLPTFPHIVQPGLLAPGAGAGRVASGIVSGK